MESNEIVNERESDAGAFVRTRPGAYDPMKALEDVRQLLLRNPSTGVADRDLDVIVAPPNRDADRALERELERVRQQVEHDLLPQVVVDEDGFGQRFAVDLEPEAGALDRRSERAGQKGGQRRDVGRFVGRLKAACFDL